MTALPESPDLSETRLQEIEATITDVLMSGAISHTLIDPAKCPRCILVDAVDEVLAEVRRLQSALTAARAEREEAVKVAAFFASCIKSGESWTATCEAEMQKLRSRPLEGQRDA